MDNISKGTITTQAPEANNGNPYTSECEGSVLVDMLSSEESNCDPSSSSSTAMSKSDSCLSLHSHGSESSSVLSETSVAHNSSTDSCPPLQSCSPKSGSILAETLIGESGNGSNDSCQSLQSSVATEAPPEYSGAGTKRLAKNNHLDQKDLPSKIPLPDCDPGDINEISFAEEKFKEYEQGLRKMVEVSTAITKMISVLDKKFKDKSDKYETNVSSNAEFGIDIEANPSTSREALSEYNDQLVEAQYAKYMEEYVDADDPFTNKCLKPLAGAYFLVAGMITTAVGVLGATCILSNPEPESSLGGLCSNSSSKFFEISSDKTELRTVMGVGAAVFVGVVQLLSAAYSFAGCRSNNTDGGGNNNKSSNEESRPLLQ